MTRAEPEIKYWWGLSADSSKLCSTGSRSAVKRSTLPDANEWRDWRIWSNFAAVLIRRAHKLYAVYALDSSTIDLCQNADSLN